MKQTKTKVLLTLLVAVAMMLFAVPAFAATTSLHIDTQPQNVKAYTGTDKASFTIAVSGGTVEGDYSYQWYKQAGAAQVPETDAKFGTAKTLYVDSVAGNAGSYYCIVADASDVTKTAQSNSATLTVTEAPTYRVASQTVDAGKTATFEVKDTSNVEKATYQWQVKTTADKAEWTNIAGATGVTYTTDKTSIDMNGYTYRCIVTDGDYTVNSAVTSGAGTLTVNDVVSIKTNPKDVTVLEGAKDAVFTVVPQGGKDGYSYEWYVDKNDGAGFVKVSGLTEASNYNTSTPGTLRISAVNVTAEMNGYKYKCVVSSNSKTAESTAATLTVNPKLAVTTTPKDGENRVASGSKVTLTANATGGAGDYHYSWVLLSARSVVLGTDASYTTDAITTNTSATTGYVCTVTDKDGTSVPSKVIYFTVTQGSISDGTVTGVKDSNKEVVSSEFTITLPEGEQFTNDINTTTDITSWAVNKPNGLTLSVVKHETGSNKLVVKFAGKPTQSSVSAIDITVPADKTVSGTRFVITENANAKYQITEEANNELLTNKPTSVVYNGKVQTTTVSVKDDYKDLVGAVSNVRYYTGMYDVTTAGETNVGDYNVVCDVASGSQYTAKPNVELGKVFHITQVQSDAINTENAGTYFTWTASKEYTGSALSADVAFANGITKAGKISKVEYVAYDADGKLGTASFITNPTTIGKYEVYVTTTGDGANVANQTRADLGTFEITKLQPKAAMFTQTPTTTNYTGSPIAVTVAPTKDYDGKVGAVTVKYFTEDGKTQLAGAPTAAGKYVIKVDVAASDTYAAATDLEVGTLTINATTAPSITYAAHVQNIGNQAAVSDWAIAGTTQQSLRMEQITISVPTTANVQIKAEAHVQNYGWMGAKTGSEVTVGTTGQSLRLEALRLQLTGTDAAKYQIRVKAHIQNYGWTDDKVIKSTDEFNDTKIGTTGEGLRMEAIKIVIEPLGTK